MLPDDALLAAHPAVQALIDAGVPREEVLAGLRGSRNSRARISNDSDSDSDSEDEDEVSVVALTRSASIQGALPPGWEERFDPGSGRKFYIHHETRSTTWTRPKPVGAPNYPALTPRGEQRLAWDLNELSTGPSTGPVAPMGVSAQVSSVAAPVAATSTTAPSQSPRGAFSRMFGRKPKPPSAASGPVHSGSAAARLGAGPIGLLATLHSAESPMNARLDALRALERDAHSARPVGATGPSSASAPTDEDAVTLINQIIEVLGSTDESVLQAALCRSIWSLSDTEAARSAFADGGGLLYVGALLASPSTEVQQEAALLLLAATTTASACEQLAAADGVAALLGMLSKDGEIHNTALQLLVSMCTHGAAPALASAGSAVPLTAELVRAAAIAKGWGGNTADGCRDARLSLTCLSAMGACGASQLEAVRLAVRSAGALPSLVALLGTDRGGIDAAAMGLLAQLELSDAPAAAELANTGGIALLCESLGGSATESSRAQAAQTLATLSASAVSAVAIAQASTAIDNLFSMIASHDAPARSAALITLANMCALGALPVGSLRSEAALAALATMASDNPPASADHTQRAAAVALIAQAAQDASSRAQLAERGVPALLAVAIAAPDASASGSDVDDTVGAALSWGRDGAVRRNATMALAHFAADDSLRKDLVAWGALAPLATQLTPSTQPDARTRAMALSALANFSFVDADALVEAGLPSRLGPLLFEADTSTLAMALTALTNLTHAGTPAAALASAPLLSAGTHLAVHALLVHADAAVRAQALAVFVQMCNGPELAAALAEAGAIKTLVRLVADAEPPAAAPLATTLRTMTVASEAARREALAANGVAALSGALLGCPDLDGRRALALALSTLLDGDWSAAYDAAGWPAILAVLHIASAPPPEPSHSLTTLHLEAARGASALLASKSASRAALNADTSALRFLTHCLTTLVAQPGMVEAEALLVTGASHALVGALTSGHDELIHESTHQLLSLVRIPALIVPLAAAGAAPAIVGVLGTAEPSAAGFLGKALGTMIAEFENVRSATLDAGGVAALSHALLALHEAPDSGGQHTDGKLAVALTLAELVRGDFGAVAAAGGWRALLATLATAAATASPAMRQLADAATHPLLDALPPFSHSATAPPHGRPTDKKATADRLPPAAQYRLDDDEQASAQAVSRAGAKKSTLAGGTYELD